MREAQQRFLSRLLFKELQKQSPQILQDAEYLQTHPELAFDETHTSDYIFQAFCDAGLNPRRVAKTAVYADVGMQEPRFGLIADMDAMEVAGSVLHACGHHAQLTHLLGVMRVLATVQPESFHFGIRMIAAPAEELGFSLQRELSMMEGLVSSRSGKKCLDEAQVFQPLQTLICCHLADNLPSRTMVMGYQTNGCAVITLHIADTAGGGIFRLSQQIIRIIEKEARTFQHAHGKGMRECNVRFDLSGLSSGVMVLFVLGNHPSDFPCVMEVAEYIPQLLAEHFGNHLLTVLDLCDAYAPLKQNRELERMVMRHAEAVGFKIKSRQQHMDGYTDLGFLSNRLAVCQPLIGGTQGMTHTRDFRVVDLETAYLLPIRLLLDVIVDYFLNK
ncbi:hypothetical protein LSG31_18010 [Fodinisporobacter ferrooxydans]|uniref:Peptidase M20 dimerisation domain-containing protein n=1 Tax=Fodinisporobacter ferrooxydans TaxID=2901836 RepID=A0ABY4CGW9_9BACL|nr:hypothetical protein LSG31_18010 [Alicyclobacillaceae bacterium MYW30-H2]